MEQVGAIPFDLTGKIAVVCGAGSILPGWGNGKAIAVVLARRGATVIGLDVDLDAASVTGEIIDGEGGTFYAVQCNATDPSDVQETFEAIDARFGRIDILVNVVGRSEPGGPVDMDPATWAAQFELNVTTAFLTCKAVIPVMERQGGGAIVNTSSVAGLRYIGKDQVGYSTAKAALMQFTKVSAVIHAPAGVRLNCVVPGLMNTPIMSRLADKYAGGDLAGLVEKRNAQVPMGRMGDAWDVAYAVLYLASNEARYVTGTELVVDGGLTAATR